MNTPIDPRQPGTGRRRSAAIAVTAFLSGLMHLAVALIFFLATSLGDAPRSNDVPHVAPYTATEFFALVGMQVLAGLILLATVYLAFTSFHAAMIAGASVVALDVLFLLIEATSVDRGTSILDEIGGLPGILLVLLPWLGPPLVLTWLAFDARRAGWTPGGSLAGIGASADTGPRRRLALAMMLGMVLGLAFTPFNGYVGFVLALLAIAIPTYPRVAHWVTAPFLAIAIVRFVVVLVSGPADAFPGALAALVLAILMLWLVRKGQAQAGLTRHDGGYSAPLAG